MRFSIITFGKGWLQLIDRMIARTTWRDDLRRGLDAFKTGGASLVDRSLAELDLRQLRARLQQCEEKCALAYQTLGKKSLDHWAGQQALDPEEKKRAFHTIDILEKERQGLIAQIASLKTPMHAQPKPESHSNIEDVEAGLRESRMP